MKFSRFQSLILIALTFFSTALFSQTNSSSPFKTIFSSDSLAGFDETAIKNKALNRGLYGLEFQVYLNQQKRTFINDKYHLSSGETESWLTDYYPLEMNTGKYSSASVNNAPCNNEDFESGTLAGWTASVGTNNGSQNYPTTNTAITIGSQVTVVSTPFTDAVVGSIPNSPLGGTKVARINNTTIGTAAVVKLSQTFSVTPTNYLYDFAYWAVMQNATSHDCFETPYMLVKIRNFANTLQGCPNFSIVAPSTGAGGCAGIGPTTWTLLTGGIQTNTGWQKFSIDLTPYMSQNVTIEVMVAHCSLTGHYGYAYFDSNCNTMNLTVNGTQTLSMPSTTVYPQVICGSNATLMAPSGLGPYAWYGPAGTFTNNTSQTVTTSLPGNYTLNMSPTGICNPPLQKIINLQFVPPTTVTASPANLCATGTNTSSTLTAVGASQYTWSPGGSTLSTIVVSPTITTIYTLTARTGTCLGTFTTEVTVNPDPVVSVLSSNFTVCPGQSATLTAFGANSYVWNPGALSGSLVVVSPTITTTYTTIGTSTAGCSGTIATNINASAAIVLTLTPFSPTYNCAGTPVNVVAGGATTFTWLPPNLTGFFQTLSPTVTTNYTVIGASGTCSNSANITLSVNPGPSITITPNPSTVCPGNSTTLTAVAPGASGSFTWAAPVSSNASSVVVTGTIAGGYSVSAKDSPMGCVSTFTANPIVSPLPTISITPSNPTVCIGSTLSLNAGGAVSYTWLPGNSNAGSISVSPTVNTTYTLIGANAAGCTVQTVTEVTVVPLPLVNASASPSALCAGSCATITPGGAASYTITGGSFNVCPLINTSYTVTGSNGAGCTSTPVVVGVTVNPTPTLIVTATPTSICQGASSTLSVSGASNYTWSTGSNATSISVSPTVSTTYTVTGANAFGCTTVQTIQVIVVPAPTISITPASASVCAGGTLALSASGATSYTWNPGSLSGANISITPTVTATYTMIGETSGCTGQNTILVTVAPIPTITAGVSPSVICAGSCATITPGGGLTYTYSSGSAVVCPTVNSTYTVSGSNAAGCTGNSVVLTVSVNSAPLLSVSASPTAVCPGNSSNLSASGAVSYTWLPMNTSGANISVTPTATTVYTLIGANAIGCTSSQTVSVTFVPTPTILATASPTAICIGANASLNASGASSYIWMPGSLSGANVFVSPTVTTTYSVTGTTAGCTGSTVITLIVNPLPSLSITASPTAVCIGGSATLTGSGAASYTWNTGSTGNSIVVSPLSNTTYSLVGTSAAGCVGNMTQLTLPVNSLPVISANASPTVICSGGSATLTALGGTSYTWQPGNLVGSSVIVNPVTLITYTVSGQNANGCIGISSVPVNVSTPPSLTISASVPSVCAGSFVNLVATGGTSYTWQPGGSNATNITVNPSSTTIYTLFGSNAAGCVGQTTLSMFVQANPVVTSNANPTSICVGSSATLSAGGASSYTWSPGGLVGGTQIVTPSVTTTYTAFGTFNTCLGFSSITVSVNPLPIVFAISTPTNICAGSTATLSAGGATSYTWQPGSLTGANVVVTPTSTTVYTVTGAANGCLGSTNVTLNVSPIPLVLASTAASVICAGETTTLLASGATTYTWLPGGSTSNPFIVSPGSTTNYTVIGQSGICTAFNTLPVTVNPLPNITAFASPATVCLGAATTLTANGAASYTWFPGSLTSNPVNVFPAASTIFTVNGLSASGCANSQTVSVTVNSLPSVTVTANSNPICSGNSATLTASGATSYSWNTGSNISSIIVNPAISTVYTVTGTNAAGCSSAISYTLGVNPSPTLNIVASSPSICAGFSVSLLATGATAYTWNPGNLQTPAILETPSVTTVYSVTGSVGSCTAVSTITITVVPLPSVSLAATPSAVCLGNTTTLTASGAVTYSWIPSLVGGSTFIDAPLVATSYTVVGFDAAGCPNYATILVNVLPNPTVSAVSTSSAICAGGSATLTANGTTNYTWNPGGLSGSAITVNPLSSTVYTVIGDNGACTALATVSLVVNPLPVITASVANSPVCAGSTVSLSASGALNYTWNPSGLTGAGIIDTPFSSVTYTVSGEDPNGCIGSATVFVLVNPNPTITASASPATVCLGASVTLNAGGALTYTWSPNNQSGAAITETPAVTTVYSVTGTDNNGCTGTETVLVNVVPIPTISISPSNPSVCIGSSTTLTANGATNYTWLPSSTNGSVIVVSPLSLTSYTVIGDNGGNCSSSATVDVFVNPLPANVLASSVGTVGCVSPTAALFGSSTGTNVSYSWSGPSGYSSASQNATVTGVWGDFTLTVTDNVTGCSATATVNVPSDNTIPLINPVVSGSITCAVQVVTITAVNTTTNAAYSWSGPSSFTGSAQSVTVALGGNYTITVTDLSSTCSSSTVVSVGVHTRVEATASITPATCTNGVSNNDGKINVLGFVAADKYDIVGGTSYTGTATYATAVNIPANGIITNNLANPSTTVAYTIRLFDGEGCIKDSTLYLIPVNCSIKTLGIAKAVSVPFLNDDGTYDVTYKVVVKNYDPNTLTGIVLTENLATSFAAANSFTVVGLPVITPQTSGLVANLNFNGSSQTNLLQSSGNSLPSGNADTVNFTVRVSTSLFFTPFKNSVLGSAINNNNQTIVDSSQAGLNPDPDNDLNPFNNNLPTVVSFTPASFFGITKVGAITAAADKTFDVSYTITIHNLGNDTVRNVSLTDSLFEKTIKSPAAYTIKSGPVLSGSGLTVNSAFDGKDDSRLILPSTSKLAPNTISSISFVINVSPGNITSISNSAYGSALRAQSATQFETVSDTSGNGINPDSNNNGIWNEPEDNLPTVLLIPALTQTLFIPEGFSPNGDNINDLFVIQGLPTTGDNSITFYNRWGNKVYENGNYDNSWDGTSNAKGTLGKDKLPQGTYYYILDMKNSGIKAISGFITIEY